MANNSELVPLHPSKRARVDQFDRPSSAGSSASMVTKESQMVEKLMINQLGIKPVDIARVKDDRVQAMVKQMAGLVISQASYRELARSLPPEVRNAPLQKIDGIELDIDGATIGTFAEKQWRMAEEFAVDYIEAFNEVASIYKLNSVKGLNIVLSALPDDQPLPNQDIASILGIESLNRAAQTLAGSNKEWIESSRAFYLNVQRMLFRGNGCEHRMDVLRDREKELQRAFADSTKVEDEISSAKGKLNAAKHSREGLAQLRQGKNQYAEWLTTELAAADRELKAAQKRLKDYTYRMWGPFVDMWRRDVELAQADVDRFTHEKQDLEQRKEAAKSQAILDTDALMRANTIEITELEERLAESGALMQRKERAEQDIQKLEQAIHKDKEEIEAVLKTAGASSLRHLRQIEETAECFADNNKVAASNRKVLKGPIQRQISTVASLVNQMQGKPTASGQRAMLRGVVSLLTQKDDQAAVFLRKCKMMEGLGSRDPVHWGLEDLDLVEEEPQLSNFALPAVSPPPGPQTLQPSLPPPAAQVPLAAIPESDDDEPTL